jgi:hypothetical protein
MVAPFSPWLYSVVKHHCHWLVAAIRTRTILHCNVSPTSHRNPSRKKGKHFQNENLYNPRRSRSVCSVRRGDWGCMRIYSCHSKRIQRGGIRPLSPIFTPFSHREGDWQISHITSRGSTGACLWKGTRAVVTTATPLI